MKVPANMVALIGSILSSSVATLTINGVATTPFLISKGLGQGGPLSPLLWNLFGAPHSAYIAASTEGVMVLNTRVHLSQYADDSKAPCDGRANATIMADRVSEWATAWGLELSRGVNKSAFTYNDGTGVIPEALAPLSSSAGLIPYATSYNYLGIPSKGTPDMDTAYEERANDQVNAYLGKRNNSNLLTSMPPAQQLQIAKAFLGA